MPVRLGERALLHVGLREYPAAVPGGGGEDPPGEQHDREDRHWDGGEAGREATVASVRWSARAGPVWKVRGRRDAPDASLRLSRPDEEGEARDGAKARLGLAAGQRMIEECAGP